MNRLRPLFMLATLSALHGCGGGAEQDPVEAPLPAPSSPPPSAGALAFSAATYSAREADGLSGYVQVVRSGGSDGIITAKVRLTGITATAVDDFDAEDIEVRFGDGDTAPRLIPLSFVQDSIEEDAETLRLTLADVLGCATLGTQNVAEMTIVDDDEPLPPQSGSYTIGGTVQGLLGSGLTLTNNSTDDLAIAANGPFVFPRDYFDGFVYNVRVQAQPTSPSQACAATNGSGTVTGTPVSDIEIVCTTVALPSGLDTSFGDAGRVTAGLSSAARDLIQQADGKLIVVGGDSIARYESSGSLDLAFGTNGIVAAGIYGATFDHLEAVALQADGRIVVAGWSRNGNNSPTQEEIIVMRLMANGAVDASFGTNGRVITDIAGRGDSAYDVLIQADGGILVTGTASVLDPFGSSDADFIVLRYTSDGALDPSFGGGGYATTNIAGRSDLARAAALQSDGKIVVAGRVANSGGANPDIGLARFDSNGTLDSSFGNGGIVRAQTVDWDEAADVVIQPDGGILIAGHTITGSESTLTLARFNSDGSTDATFGSNGRVTSALMMVGRALALQANGSIVTAGWKSNTSADFVIARFSGSGALDTSFGEQGALEVDFFGGADTPYVVAIQGDGRILIGGGAANGTQSGVGIVRITP